MKNLRDATRIVATVDGEAVEITNSERVQAGTAAMACRSWGQHGYGRAGDHTRIKAIFENRVPSLKYASFETFHRIVEQLAGETVALTVEY